MACPKKKRYATHITLSDGSRKYVSAPTKRELNARIAEIRKNDMAGVALEDKTTLAEYTKLWLIAYHSPDIKEQSYKITERNATNHVINAALGGMEMRKIRQINVIQHLNTLTCGKTTRVRVEYLLRRIFQSAEESGLIIKSPMPYKKVCKAEAPEEKVPLTNEQAVLLLNSVRSEPLTYRFCRLALSLGLRRGEVFGLRWENVDLGNKVVHVCRTREFIKGGVILDEDNTKTPAGERDLPIPASLLPELTAWREEAHRGPFLIPGRAEDGGTTYSDTNTIWHAVERRTASEDRPLGTIVPATRKGGRPHPALVVDIDFYVTPHILRHTFITQLFEAGMDIKQVQKLAGHADPDVTIKIYTHFREQARRQETINQMDEATAYLATGTEGVVIPFPGGKD